jgi:hypothetical protein
MLAPALVVAAAVAQTLVVVAARVVLADCNGAGTQRFHTPGVKPRWVAHQLLQTAVPRLEAGQALDQVGGRDVPLYAAAANLLAGPLPQRQHGLHLAALRADGTLLGGHLEVVPLEPPRDEVGGDPSSLDGSPELGRPVAADLEPDVRVGAATAAGGCARACASSPT